MRREPRIHRKALPDIVEVTQKNKCIKEIFTSEASYVDDLSVAIKVSNSRGSEGKESDEGNYWRATERKGTHNFLGIQGADASLQNSVR